MPIAAERRIADKYFGAAKEWGPAINARGYRIGISEFCSDIVGDAVFRIVERPARPLARTIGLQTPNDGQTAQRPLPQPGIGIAMVNITLPVCRTRSH